MMKTTYVTPGNSRREFISGMKAELPILLGVVPFGMIYGVAALSAGIPAGAAQAMSAIIFAGSAQFIFAQLFGHGAPLFVLVATAWIVNLRHALYSASVAPYLKPLKPVWKWSLAYLLTDEAYAVSILHYRQDSDPSEKHWFFLGAGLALWATWQISTVLGVLLGAKVPAGLSLDFTLVLTFIALVVPALEGKPGLVAALAAGVVAVLGNALPYKLGLLLAALVGILAGLWVEGRR